MRGKKGERNVLTIYRHSCLKDTKTYEKNNEMHITNYWSSVLVIIHSVTLFHTVEVFHVSLCINSICWKNQIVNCFNNKWNYNLRIYIYIYNALRTADQTKSILKPDYRRETREVPFDFEMCTNSSDNHNVDNLLPNGSFCNYLQ